MELSRIITSLNQFGIRLQNHIDSEFFQAKFKEAHFYNRWFTEENVKKSVDAISREFLDGEKLEKWVSDYPLPVKNSKKVGIVMAGNIPLVGFHDLLAVLMSGHEAVVKLSSKDDKLLPFMLQQMEAIDEALPSRVHIQDKLTNYDAVIATGSNNTARYFEYYFGRYPHVIRKNRNGVAVLTGNESKSDLRGLGEDIFRYFGLGCRNVSKIYVPEGYDFNPLFEVLDEWKGLIDHKKYENNYLYNKSFLVMDDEPFMDTGFFMVRENHEIPSPIAMLHVGYYQDTDQLKAELRDKRNEIQCIIGAEQIIEEIELEPGKAQQPRLSDYPDNIDTLRFLASLDKTPEKV